MLAGRRIVLGITGGVAAYKAAYIARRLVEHGATVRTVMTPSATRFIGEATFAALTGFDPVVDLFESEEPSPHTTLAAWADLIIVAPTTASTIAKLATGESSNALVATVIASEVPVILAPAMHTEMWQNRAVTESLHRLEAMGYEIIDPEEGELAGGDVGVGRLADPDTIVAAVVERLTRGPLGGMRVIVTGGGTREPIDPVRFIGNRSSGKMGNAIARAAAAYGATVTLVSSAPDPGVSGVSHVHVETADQMAEAVWSRLDACDIAVMAAAVADFKPADVAQTKMKRSDGAPVIELVPTPDILKGVAESDNRPFLVGFAAETGSLADAEAKAKRKGVDLLVGNDVTAKGSGFGSDTNQVTFFYADGTATELPLMDKDDVARRLWDEVARLRGGA